MRTIERLALLASVLALGACGTQSRDLACDATSVKEAVLVQLMAGVMETFMGDPAMRLVSVIEDDRIVLTIPAHLQRMVGADQMVMHYTVSDGVMTTNFDGTENSATLTAVETVSRTSDGAECRAQAAAVAEEQGGTPQAIEYRTRRAADGGVEVSGTSGDVRF